MLNFKIAIYDFPGGSDEDELSVYEKQVFIALAEDDEWTLVVSTDKLIDHLDVTGLVGSLDDKLKQVKGLGGLVPSNYLSNYDGDVAHAIHQYDAQDKDEHDLIEGEQVLLIPCSDNDWSLALKGGQLGIVPKSYVEFGSFHKDSAPLIEEEEENIFMTVMDTAPMNIKYYNAHHLPTSTSSRKHGTQGAIGVSNTHVLFVNLKVLTVYKQYVISICKVSKTDKKIIQVEDMIFKLDTTKDADEFINTFNEAKSGKSVERDLVKETMDGKDKKNASGEINKQSIKVLHDTVQKTATGTTPAAKSPKVAPEPPKYGKVLYNFKGEDKDEISVLQDQFVLLFKQEDDWIDAELLDSNLKSMNKRGYIPFNYVVIKSKESLLQSIAPQVQPRVQPRVDSIVQPIAQPVPFKLPPVPQIPSIEAPRPTKSPEPPQLPPPIEDSKPQLPHREVPQLPKQQSPISPQTTPPPLPSRTVKPPIPSRPEIAPVQQVQQVQPVASPSIKAPPKANVIDQTGLESQKELPNNDNLRMWKDKSGGFSVRAEFLGLFDDKVHLFKTNGVKIGVPLEKLCNQDREWISNQLQDKSITKDNQTAFQGFDWLPWFKEQCKMDENTAKQYAIICVKERLDLQLLKELTKDDLKSLGFAQGDILRIQKATTTTTVNKEEVLEQEQRLEAYFKSKPVSVQPVQPIQPVQPVQPIQPKPDSPTPTSSKQSNQFNSLPSRQTRDTVITKVREPIAPTIIERRKEIPKSFTTEFNTPQRQQRQNSGSSIQPTDSASQVHTSQSMQNFQNTSTYQQPLYYNPALQNMQRQQQLRGQTPLVAQPIQQQGPNMQQQMQQQMQIQMQQQQLQMMQQQLQNPQMNQMNQIPNAQFIQHYQMNRPGPQPFALTNQQNQQNQSNPQFRPCTLYSCST